MKILPVGTEITCPECGRVMCRVKVQLQAGDRIMVEQFESVDGKIQSHAPMICPFDGAQYGLTGRGFHTKDGWV